MKMRYFAILVLFLLILIGWTFFGSHRSMNSQRTHRSVAVNDLISKWTWIEGEITMTIELNPQGEFVQVIHDRKTGDIRQTGTWSLNREMSIVILDPCLQKIDNRWQTQKVTWFVADSSRDGKGVALSGGIIPDPDFFAEMRRNP